MSKQLRIWLFVLLGTLLTSTSLLAEGVITMVFDKSVGSTVALNIQAKGDITIEGAQETGQTGTFSQKIYTIKSQTITIRGDMTELSCSDDRLYWLDASGCTSLESLFCSVPAEQYWEDKQEGILTGLNVSGCTALTTLFCQANRLTTLDVSDCTALTELYCDINQLTSLDISKNTALTRLSCGRNQLTSLDVSKNTALTELYCSDNQLTSLDVSKNTALTELYCSNDQLTSLDVSKNTALTKLDCSLNQLTSLDVSKNTAFTTLKCWGNRLTNLDLSTCLQLNYLDCSANQIKGVAMTQLVASLPTCSSNQGQFGSFIVVSNLAPEGNVCSKADLATARTKNWNSLKRANRNESLPYEGEDDNLQVGRGVITIKTTKAIGEVIALAIKADGGVAIEGVKPFLQPDGNIAYYTLTSQTIIIRGDVTELSCSDNQLASLNASGCTSLTKLSCSRDQLTSLDVSGCTALTELDCYDLKLGSLDISGCTALTRLVCGSSWSLTSLKASGCTALTTLYCRYNQLTSLDVSGCISLTSLYCRENHLTSLDVSDCTALTTLDCGWNSLTNLDLSGCTALTELNCFKNQLTSLNVSGCAALTELGCSGNQLTSLDVSGCTALTTLDCGWNSLTSLDVSGCTSLTQLDCCLNRLTSLDLSGCAALTRLTCEDNQLTSLNVSGCAALTELGCSGNQLTSLDVSGCTALTELGCSGNQLTSLDVSGCTALTTLDCGWNSLTSLDVSGCTSLTQLDCCLNRLTSLDLSGCAALTRLTCEDNQLTSLNLSGCTALTWLTCEDNQLTSLNVSGCTALTKLDCRYNQLTSLDLSTCSSLNYVDCFENQIKGESMTQLVASLPTCNSGNQEESGEFIVVSNSAREGNFCSKANVASARAKNWTSLKSIDGKLIPYKGESDNPQQPVGSGIIKMTTTRAIGETIKLGFKANGEVVIEGAKTPLQPDGQIAYYTLSSQTIIIRGDLTEFNCAGSQLASLDVSDCPSLIKLDCGNSIFERYSRSGDLRSLNASGCTALTELTCQYNRLTNLDVSGCTSLTELDCWSNQLTSLDLSGCTALTELDCGYNQLTSLDLSHSSTLIELNCYGNALTSLDLSKCLNLRYVDCSTNRIKGEAMNRLVASLPTCSGDYHGQYSDRNSYSGGYFVAVSSSDYEWNICSKENVASAHAKNWTTLNKMRGFKYYNLELVPYEGVDESQLVGHGVITMTTEKAVGEPITLLFKANSPVTLEGVKEILQSDGSTTYQILPGQKITLRGDVTALRCGESELTSLDVSDCPSLTRLECWDNQLTNLDVSQNSALNWLNCGYNQLTSLNVSQNSALDWLGCYNNQLTSLDLSQNSALIDLYCQHNQFTSLDLSQNSVLNRLNCGYNQLTSLDLSHNSRLSDLWCSNNQIKGAEMTKLVNSLPKKSGEERANFYVVVKDSLEGNVCLKSDVAILANKGWTPLGYNRSTEVWEYYGGRETDSFAVSLTHEGEGVLDATGADDLKAVPYGTKLTITATPAEGYELAALTANGFDILESKSFEVTGYTEIKATFRKKTFAISLAESAHGAIAIAESVDLQAVPYGTTLTITATPETGYELTALTANDKDILATKSFVVKSDTEVKATFTKQHFAVTLTQEGEGKVNATGADNLKAVPYGTELIIEATPAEGYELTALTANGQDILATRKVVVTRATEIKATFVKKTFVVTLPQEGEGTITARGAEDLSAVPYGTELIIEATPAEGYELTTLTANGQDILATRKVVVTEATEIKATFVKKTFVVTLEKAGEGDLSTTGADNLKKVPYGTELTIIATPAAGYELASIVVDGVNITATKKVVIKDNVTVKATFVKKTFKVTLTKEGEGTITATGASNLNAVAYGTELTIVATPAAGYELQSLVVDGVVNITATKKVVVTDNVTIKATFVDHTGVETTVTQETQLYPNPATDYVIVEGVAAASEVTLHSMTGERLYAGRADDRGSLQIDLTPYADGVYLVCVAGETYRVVVRR